MPNTLILSFIDSFTLELQFSSPCLNDLLQRCQALLHILVLLDARIKCPHLLHMLVVQTEVFCLALKAIREGLTLLEASSRICPALPVCSGQSLDVILVDQALLVQTAFQGVTTMPRQRQLQLLLEFLLCPAALLHPSQLLCQTQNSSTGSLEASKVLWREDRNRVDQL